MRFLRGSFRRREAVHRAILVIASALTTLILLAALPSSAGQTDTATDSVRVHWKYLEMAQLRLDDKAPLKWNVYQPDKKDNKKDKKKDSDLVLVLLGHRYLMLDTRAHLVYLVPLSDLQAQGADFESGDLAQQSRVIPSTEWTERDVGPAELIRLTLGDYGSVLEVSLPHMPDLRPFY
jgi:hypothetical protein